MRVAYLPWDASIASVRYRQILPGRELGQMGVEVTAVPEPADVLIATKHGYPPEILGRYPRVVVDVCDDHFADRHADSYRQAINKAQAVTCNSQAMRWRIWQETRRVATVIPDPYELDEVPPSWGDGLLWFGHRSNLPDLQRELPALSGYQVRVMSNAPGCLPWSLDGLRAELDRCAVVILPTGKSPCKSANRMLEAIRRGKYVVANPLPAYEGLGMWTGDIRDGVDWAYAHQREALDAVRDAQDELWRYSPLKIAQQWMEVIGDVEKGPVG